MSANLLGTKVGHFRVVDLLSKGGMGEVYVGYDEKLERKVALKAIRPEHRLDERSKARFLREARVLSQLNHPGICQIFDYIEGAEADVLVLELVEGKKLSSLEERRLDIRKRLFLAIELTEALVAAHGKGIVHRDLKPDNVMLDNDGHIKILDFGLSRSLADDETIDLAELGPPDDPPASREGDPHAAASQISDDRLSPFRTKHGSILGTPDYMSPEQAHGEPATSASDVYSLGLVLQELLTGERARAGGGSLSERLERAKNGESRPVKGLDSDLTSLVERMKSLVPAARPTAIETVDRLRWIQAKPARKRKRFLTAAAIVVLAAFSIGATVQAVLIAKERNRANLERDRANQEADHAKKTLAFLTRTFEVANPRKGKGPSATASEIIDDAMKKLDETTEQPLLRASLQTTLSEIYDEMGLYDAAEPLAKSALEIREKALGPSHLDVAASLSILANIWRRQGKLTEAEQLTQRSLKIRETALGPNHADVATSLNNLATLYADQGKLAEAEPLYRRSMETWEKALGPNHPDVATSLNNLASVYIDQGKLAEAEPLLTRSLEIREKALGPDHPDVAMTLNNIADLYRSRGKLAEAELLLKRSLEIKEKALGPNHPDAALALYNLGVVALGRGKRADALAYMRRAIPLFVGTSYWKALVEEDPAIAPLRADPEFQRLVAKVKKN
jgi:serine/threonine protein kinase